VAVHEVGPAGPTVQWAGRNPWLSRPFAIDGVRTFGTRVKFADSPEAARRQALANNRPVLLVHSPGDWAEQDGPGGDAGRLRVGAFADQELGQYLNERFVIAFVRVGERPAVQGGPVASYFCRADGSVLHAVVGPVGAEDYLNEARSAVWLHRNAAGRTNPEVVRARHVVRDHQFDLLPDTFRDSLSKTWLPGLDPPEPVSDRALRLRSVAGLSPQARVSLLIAAYPLASVEDIHRTVWTHILGQPPPAGAPNPR
jgi:hypothetical protein